MRDFVDILLGQALLRLCLALTLAPMLRTLVQDINASRPATHMPTEMMQSEWHCILNLLGAQALTSSSAEQRRPTLLNRRHDRRSTNPIWHLPTLEVGHACRSPRTLAKGMPLV